MAGTSQDTRETTFNFRLDSALKAAFTAAAEAEHKSAAEVLRRFMRSYVEQKQRSVFEAEAHRQALAIAARAHDPKSDEHEAMRELDAELDCDGFAVERATHQQLDQGRSVGHQYQANGQHHERPASRSPRVPL